MLSKLNVASLLSLLVVGSLLTVWSARRGAADDFGPKIQLRLMLHSVFSLWLTVGQGTREAPKLTSYCSKAATICWLLATRRRHPKWLN